MPKPSPKPSPKRSSKQVDVTIRLDRAAAARLDDIVRALEASGVTNLDVHRRFFVASGTIAASRIPTLRKIDGVASVREDRTYRTQ